MHVPTITPAQFNVAFKTEKQCRDYLLKAKHPNGFKCRKCGHDHYWEVDHRGGSWMCSSCGYQESAKSGTIMHRSKLSILQWFKAIYEITATKGGVAATELQYKLGIKNYHPAWYMLQKIRCAMGLRDEEYTLKNYVELDVAIFGKRVSNTQARVYIAVESKPTKDGEHVVGFAMAKVVGEQGAEDSKCFSTRSLEPLTEVRTDGGSDLVKLEEDTDLVLDMKVMGGDKVKLDKHLPWVHKLISNIKTALTGTFHGVSSQYLQLYLDEYIYRFNRRWCRPQLVGRLINACVVAGPPVKLYST